MPQSNVYVSYIQVGPKIVVTFDHQGPVSYATGGETVNASDLGVGGFEFIDLENVTPSGTFMVQMQPTAQGTGNATSSFLLIWFTTTAVGVQSTQVTNATNLSAQTVRLQLFCV